MAVVFDTAGESVRAAEAENTETEALGVDAAECVEMADTDSRRDSVLAVDVDGIVDADLDDETVADALGIDEAALDDEPSADALGSDVAALVVECAGDDVDERVVRIVEVAVIVIK